MAMLFIFFTDAIVLLNKLHLRLQGNEELICVLARQVCKFMLKLKFFIVQINNNFICVILTQ